MAAELVPTTRTLSDIYPAESLAQHSARWRRLLATFSALYEGHRPDFVARSPGRVNIIGEHIDYSLYAVLPMAIEADALVAVEVLAEAADEQGGGGVVRLEVANTDPERYPARVIEVRVPPGGETDAAPAEVDIDAGVHEWTNYFKAGLRGALELMMRDVGAASRRPRALRVLVDGTVPPGGGLSSSAAFVTASALAVLVANGAAAEGGGGGGGFGDVAVPKKDLTELAIVSERAVGVNSGGMDQSASVFSQRGAALFVSFVPSLSARPVFFPAAKLPAGRGDEEELCFVIAQSFVTADKHVTGPIHYNLRVVECTLAAAFLNAVVLGPDAAPLLKDASPLGVSLHGFQERYFASSKAARPSSEEGGLSPIAQLDALVELVEATLTQVEGYTREEIAGALGITVPQLEATYVPARFPVRAERFKLRQRALHVYSEAARALRFMALLESPPDPDTAVAAASDGEGGGGGGSALGRALGALLDESQASCRELFECSCGEIDALCAIARRPRPTNYSYGTSYGTGPGFSYGSRLTGAGWGGCTVHLVPAWKVPQLRKAWEDEYYAKLGRELTDLEKEGSVVVSRPGGGSAVVLVDENGEVGGLQ